MSKKDRLRNLLTRVFRTRTAAPLRNHARPLGRAIEQLEDRTVPAPVASSLSMNKLYIDSTSSPVLPSTYVGYKLTGDGATYQDVYATIGTFSTGVGLATNAPSQVRLGTRT